MGGGERRPRGEGSLAFARPVLRAVRFDSERGPDRRHDPLLSEFSLALEDTSNAIRWEYSEFRRIVTDVDSWSDLRGGNEAVPRFLFLEQRTLRQVGEHYRASIVEGERTGRVTAAFEVDVRNDWPSFLAEGNPVGRSRPPGVTRHRGRKVALSPGRLRAETNRWPYRYLPQ